MLLIAVHPDRQEQGIGARLMTYIETKLKDAGQRTLIVETSDLPDFELTRRYYRKIDYQEKALIREYYDVGEGKVVFWEKLVG